MFQADKIHRHIYIDGTSGDDSNDGLTSGTPVQTIAAVRALLPVNRVIDVDTCVHCTGEISLPQWVDEKSSDGMSFNNWTLNASLIFQGDDSQWEVMDDNEGGNYTIGATAWTISGNRATTDHSGNAGGQMAEIMTGANAGEVHGILWSEGTDIYLSSAVGAGTFRIVAPATLLIGQFSGTVVGLFDCAGRDYMRHHSNVGNSYKWAGLVLQNITLVDDIRFGAQGSRGSAIRMNNVVSYGTAGDSDIYECSVYAKPEKLVLDEVTNETSMVLVNGLGLGLLDSGDDLQVEGAEYVDMDSCYMADKVDMRSVERLQLFNVNGDTLEVRSCGFLDAGSLSRGAFYSDAITLEDVFSKRSLLSDVRAARLILAHVHGDLVDLEITGSQSAPINADDCRIRLPGFTHNGTGNDMTLDGYALAATMEELVHGLGAFGVKGTSIVADWPVNTATRRFSVIDGAGLSASSGGTLVLAPGDVGEGSAGFQTCTVTEGGATVTFTLLTPGSIPRTVAITAGVTGSEVITYDQATQTYTVEMRSGGSSGDQIATAINADGATTDGIMWAGSGNATLFVAGGSAAMAGATATVIPYPNVEFWVGEAQVYPANTTGTSGAAAWGEPGLSLKVPAGAVSAFAAGDKIEVRARIGKDWVHLTETLTA